MKSEDIHKQFQQWAQQYGPVFSLIMGPKIIVVLSSDVAVKEVLDKQSSITNERGDHYVGHDVLSGGERMLLMVCEIWALINGYLLIQTLARRCKVASSTEADAKSASC
jgi:hypothetical protein